MNGQKVWKCENGHIMGLIRRDEVWERGRKRKVTRLMLFRQAFPADMNEESLNGADVIAIVEGTANISCSMPKCCATRPWFYGHEALEHLLEKRS